MCVEEFDEGTWHLFARIGITPDYMQRETCGMAAVEQDIRYKAEVFAGDLITVKSSIPAEEEVDRFRRWRCISTNTLREDEAVSEFVFELGR